MSLSFKHFALCYLGFVFLCWAIRSVLLKKLKRHRLPLPPFVPLSSDDVNKRLVESMTRALRENGPVVRVKRNGQTEFLVSAECTQEVFTRADTFASEEALAKQASPIFDRAAAEVAIAGESGQPVDVTPHIKRAMVELSIQVLLGKKFLTPENCHCTQQVVEDIVELTGLNRRQSRLGRGYPILWTIKTWIEVALFRLPYHMGTQFTSCLWADIRVGTSENNLISYLVSKHGNPGGVVPMRSKIHIMALIWTIIFAAVHQTATISVWVTFFLARHRDMQDALCGEHDATRVRVSVAGDSEEAWTNDPTRAVYADSFIREVLRMKPDAINAARTAVKDTELAGFFIPKGSLVFPVTFLSDRNPAYATNPDVFDPERWLCTGKTAVMPGMGYLPFGLGRYACPGRFLSVIEIKIWLLALTKVATFELEGDSYEIMDAFSISTSAPRGRLLLSRRAA